MTEALRTAVAHELETMSLPGSELDPLGVRASSARARTLTARRGVEVAEEFLALQSGVRSGGRVTLVTAGPPGSGKSTWIEQWHLRAQGFREIDPDIVKDLLLRHPDVLRDLSDLLSHELPDGRPMMPRELASLVHVESTRIAHNVLQVALRRGEDIVIPGTLGWAELPDQLLRDFETHGYEDLTIVDVEVPQAVAIERSQARWWRDRVAGTDPLGGRFVPRRIVAQLYGASGTTVCRANALYMFGKSDLEATGLITIDGVTGEVSERRKLDGEEFPAEARLAEPAGSSDGSADPSTHSTT